MRPCVEQPEARLLDIRMLIERLRRRTERHPRRGAERIAVHARGDGGERDPVAAVLGGERYRPAMARGEKLGLARLAPAPHRADGVDDVARVRDPPGARDPRLARGTAAEHAALPPQVGSRRAVDRPIHTCPAPQTGVRGVHDRVRVHVGCDVSFVQRDPPHSATVARRMLGGAVQLLGRRCGVRACPRSAGAGRSRAGQDVFSFLPLPTLVPPELVAAMRKW